MITPALAVKVSVSRDCTFMGDNGRFAGGKDGKADRVGDSEQIRWLTLFKLCRLLDLWTGPHHMHGGGCGQCWQHDL